MLHQLATFTLNALSDLIKFTSSTKPVPRCASSTHYRLLLEEEEKRSMCLVVCVGRGRQKVIETVRREETLRPKGTEEEKTDDREFS